MEVPGSSPGACTMSFGNQISTIEQVIVVSTKKSMSKELQKIVGKKHCFYIENLKGVI